MALLTASSNLSAGWAGAGAADAAASHELEMLLQEAHEAYKAGDYPRALSLCQPVRGCAQGHTHPAAAAAAPISATTPDSMQREQQQQRWMLMLGCLQQHSEC
jgi:hypothetical protein